MNIENLNYSGSINFAEPDTIAYRLYQTLCYDIRRGILKPGMPLKIEWLRNKYQVSISPCREALARLAAEAYVFAEAKKGFRVRQASLKDYKDIAELQNELEQSALRKSICNARDDWDDRLVISYHRLSKVKKTKMKDIENMELREDRHRDFHLELLSGCDSPWLLGCYNQLSNHAERYRRIFLQDAAYDYGYTEDVDREHLQLMELAQQGKVDEAVALLNSHRARTTNEVIAAMEKFEALEDGN